MGTISPAHSQPTLTHTRHVEYLSALEREMIPAYAAQRDALAIETDPCREHRFSRKTSAFACSLSSSFVVSPHDDSGVACETIVFTNRNGPLRKAGHTWSFAVGGHIHPLPNEIGSSVVLFVKGSGLFHGTLPTSSVEDTFLHGNHGSALVTKKQMVDALRAQAKRGERTPPEKRASLLYAVPVGGDEAIREQQSTDPRLAGSKRSRQDAGM